MSYEVQREQAHYMLDHARRDEVKIRATLLLEILDELEVYEICAIKHAAVIAITNGWNKKETYDYVSSVTAETRASLAKKGGK